jgi:DNA-binding beta-propeller fold protein YncE
MIRSISRSLVLLLCLSACGRGPSNPGNTPPIISEIIPSKRTAHLQERIGIRAIFSDADNDTLTTRWTATVGFLSSTSGDTVTWTAPDTAATARISLKVEDGKGGKAEKSITIPVANASPVVSFLTPDPATVGLNSELTMKVKASDPDGDPLSYTWSEGSGHFVGSTDGDSVRWIAPPSPGTELITVTVSDSKGKAGRDTLTVIVYSELGSCWVADSGNHQVVKLSGDGRNLFSVGGFGTPAAVAVNPDDGSCWVADQERNSVVKLSASGQNLTTVGGFSLPRSVTVYPLDGSCWVADSDSNRVVRLSRDGGQIALIRGFNLPQAVAVNRVNGDCWVADTNNNRVVRLDESVPSRYNPATDDPSLRTIITGLGRPSALDVDPITGDCWVATADNVVKIGATGQILVSVRGVSRPGGVSVDPVTGACWVADTNNNRVIRLSRDVFEGYTIGTDQGFHLPRSAFTPFNRPGALAIDPSGDCWVADTYNNRMLKLVAKESEQELDFAKSDGLPIVVTGFSLPRSVSVNTGR